MEISYNDLTDLKEVLHKKIEIVNLKIEDLEDLDEDVSEEYDEELCLRIDNLNKFKRKMIKVLDDIDEISFEFQHEDFI